MISANFRKWAKLLFTQYSMYSLFKATATTSSLRSDDVEYHSKMLSARSNVVSAGLLAIIGFTYSGSLTVTEDQGSLRLLVPCLVLIWSMINRAYYENLPVEEFQKRVQVTTPMLAAGLYLVPELYEIFFVASEAFKVGGWSVPAMIVSLFLVHILFRWIGRKMGQ
ncbi:hypothetical protein DL96DRAFT_1639418, partial [Flagelloscypha sp. PMI_526]